MAGKFFDDLADPDTLPRVKLIKPPAVKKPREQLTGKKGCKACPLRECWSRISTTQMDTAGNLRKGDILVLGASPSEQDDHAGAPFSNDAALLFKKLIPGRHKKRLIYQNLVRCYDPANDDNINVPPIKEAAYACSKYLGYDLEDNNVVAILGVGQGPLSYFWPGAQIWQVYGLKFPVQINDKVYWYYPVMDPNTILTGQRYKESKYKDPEWDPMWPVIRGDIDKLFKEVDQWPTPKIYPFDLSKVKMCFTEAEAREAMAKLKRPYGVDIETNKLKALEYGARILSVSFADEDNAVAWPIAHREATNDWGLSLMFEYLREARWIAHNAGFEWLWFQVFGNNNDPLPMHFECTQARARILLQREMGLSLASLTRMFLGFDVKELHQLDVKRLDDYPIKEVLSYNGLDAIACKRLHTTISSFRIKEDPNYERLIGAIISTVRMEMLGLPTDAEAEKELRIVWQAKAAKAEEKIRKIYEVKAFERNTGKALDISSTSQIADVLVKYGKVNLPKTAKGNYRTDMDTLAMFAGDHPLVKQLQSYREATKYISTYLDPIKEVPERYPDGLLHPGYTTTLVSTLRLSGTDPNIQNYPKRRFRELRRVVIGGKGYVLLSIDFGQLEVRILAMVSGDPVLSRSIIDGDDMHSLWLNKLLKFYPDYLNVLAEETNETDEAKIRKGGRDIIKTHFVFKSFYGGAAHTTAEITKIPLKIIEGFLEEFWSTYKGVRNWHKQVREYYKRTGSSKFITGAARHAVLPGNELINNPIQHTGAQIVGDARNALTLRSIQERDIYLQPRIDVHDDLTFIIPDDDRTIEKYWDILSAEMVKVRYDWQTVPLMVEGKVGYDWSEFEEIGKHVGDYVK